VAASAPQDGILPEPPESAFFLVLRLRERASGGRAAARALARVPELARTIGRLDPRARLRSVAGVGPELWELLSPGRLPRALRAFPAQHTPAGRAPATGGDLLLHAAARRPDLCFELARRLRRELGDAAEVAEEVHAFRYLDGRDLTGFIDGTENPKGARARAAAALIGAEDRAFAGGSYVFTQRWVHDLAKWEGVAQREQEGVVGRKKRDSRELSDRTKPPTAHIARTVIEEDGEELEIVRHSLPYGTTSECGLFFIAYTKDLAIPEKMMRRMFGASDDGLSDRLLEFTRPVTGATFFAPPLRMLRSLGRL
jgi:putative iron-dependent peroxidase